MPYIGAGIQRFNTADGLTVNGNAEVTGTSALTGAVTASGGATLSSSSSGEFNALTVSQANNTSGNESRIRFKRTTDAGSDREVAAIVADRVGGNDTALAFETNTDGSDGATERVRIDQDGKVGIGTNSPSTQFHVSESGSANATQRIQADVDGYAGELHLYGNNVGGAAYNAIKSFVDGDSTPQWEITGPEASAEDVMTIHTGGSERVRVHSGGAVSIGTTSAPSKFTVSNAGTDNIIEAANTSNSVRAGMQADTSVVGIGAITNHSVDFRTNATVRMRLHLGGDLSLGTTTQAGRFNIENADNGENVVRIKNTSTSFNNDMLQLICSRDSAMSEYNALTVFDNNTDLKMLIRPDGDLENANNAYTGFSDQNLKENIIDSGSQWDDVKALRVRKYNFIGETATQLGVIAQEVEAAGMGGLVSESTNMLTEETHKSLKYSVLYMKAVKALQEAMTRIETLETEMTALKARVTTLEGA